MGYYFTLDIKHYMSRISEEQSKEMAALYKAGQSSIKIAQQYNTSFVSVLKHVRSHNVKIRSISESHRRYTLDDNYFSRIDSHEKAQLLGMIAADGNVSSKNNLFEITLQHEDGYYLEYMRSCFRYTGPLYHPHNKKLNTDYVRLSITSSKFREDLIRLGITPRKSLTLAFPSESIVPIKFINSYLLGLIEGDGSIAIRSKGPCHVWACVKIVCPLGFGQEVKRTIEEMVGVTCGLYPVKRYQKKHSQVYNINVGGTQQVLKLCEWLYKDAPFRLKRKYERYQYLLSFFENGNERIRPPDWIATAQKKTKETHARNGTRPGRKSQFDVYLLSPAQEVFRVRWIKAFAKAMDLLDVTLYKMANGKRKEPHRGWSLSTPDQIASARTAGTLVTRFY